MSNMKGLVVGSFLLHPLPATFLYSELEETTFLFIIIWGPVQLVKLQFHLCNPFAFVNMYSYKKAEFKPAATLLATSVMFNFLISVMEIFFWFLANNNRWSFLVYAFHAVNDNLVQRLHVTCGIFFSSTSWPRTLAYSILISLSPFLPRTLNNSLWYLGVNIQVENTSVADLNDYVFVFLQERVEYSCTCMLFFFPRIAATDKISLH
jgi:hypothetical protein